MTDNVIRIFGRKESKVEAATVQIGDYYNISPTAARNLYIKSQRHYLNSDLKPVQLV